jgi:4a-hydroxytetrahydrobiopterin dehydratase
MKTAAAQKQSNPNASKLQGHALTDREKKLGHGWKVAKQHVLQKEFKFPDFAQALEFTNRVGAVAEQLDHHPDIYLTYGQVRLELSTHSAGGLTENDFILAEKINELE